MNIKERIQANQQCLETNNVLFEVGLHQKTLYRTVVIKGANARQTKEIINLLLKDIKKSINTQQHIKFPKNKNNSFTEIYIPLESKLVSINYLVLHNLLPIRGGSECKLCSGHGIEYNTKHIFVECTAVTLVRRHVQDWLSNFNVNNFNHETIYEMKNIKDLPNYEAYTRTLFGKKRRHAQFKDINEQAVINSLDSNLRFYITHLYT